MGAGVSIGRRLSRRGILGKSAGMPFVEYLVILLLVAVGSFVLLSWRPWEEWSQPVRPPRARPEPAQQPGQAQQLAQVHQAPAPQQTQPTAQPQAAQGNKKIYLVPLGAFPSSLLERLVEYYRDKHGLKIEVLPDVQMEREVFREAFDASRRQMIGEELIALMKRQYPAQANDPDAILIGITRGDMYLRFRPDWGWAFAMREGGRFAVVASARMDPRNFREPPDPELLQIRLRKMISKQIGALYFGLPESRDRKSVMFSPILGLEDLDEIGEDF